jgi:hypothetical protein
MGLKSTFPISSFLANHLYIQNGKDFLTLWALEDSRTTILGLIMTSAAIEKTGLYLQRLPPWDRGRFIQYYPYLNR